MRPRFVLVIVTALGTSASPAQSQPTNNSPETLAAFSGIVLTPAGALPQIFVAQRRLEEGAKGTAAVRYGWSKFTAQPDLFSTIGVSGGVHLKKRFRLGATIGHRSCGRCEGLTMGGVDLFTSVYHKGASRDTGGDTDVGFLLNAGMGKADSSDILAQSLTLSLPLAVSLEQVENSVLTLYVSPSLAHGSLRDTAGVTLGGWKPMIGAGMGYQFAFGMGVHAAAHKVIIDDSPTNFGLAVSWQFGGKH